MIRPPPIDLRKAPEIAEQLHALLKFYAGEWQGAERPGDFGEALDFGGVLVQIFARYAEIVIERLNRAPEKNLLAYLDMLGAALRPPQSAQVPLVFSLAAGSTADAVVPAGTQVAAAPVEGETTPVIFETERELVVVAATLDKIFVRQPQSDSFEDLSDLISAAVSDIRRVFCGTTEIDHSLYVGLDNLLGRSDLRELRLHFDIVLSGSPPDPREVCWSIVDGADGMEIKPAQDSTAKLAQTGQVTFAFSCPLAVPPRSVNRLQSRWLRGRLSTPIAPGDKFPEVTGLTASAVLGNEDGVPLDRAFANTAPLDVTKDFLPFGERPRLGDALYLSADDAFSMAEAQVTLSVTLSVGNTPYAQGQPRLVWEYWDGGRWAAVVAFSDETAALTKPGDVKFKLGKHPAMLTVSGADGYWIRVRIAGGDYGKDADYKPVSGTSPTKTYEYTPPTLAPPSVAATTVTYIRELKDQTPDRILTCNDFDYARFEGTTLRFTPFRAIVDQHPTLYLGFALPDDRHDFPNRPVSLLLGIDEPFAGTPPDNPSAAEPPRLVWECWTGQNGWQRPGLRDDTHGLTHSGVLEFLAPAGYARRTEFGTERYWLRCRWEAGAFAFEPRLRRLVLNAVIAEQASTIVDETLGSSDGSLGQRFVTMRHPILHNREELWIREPDLPAAHERGALRSAAGNDAVAVTHDFAGRPTEIWVRWREVPDFYGSGPRDRHYVLDHISGTVSFGDGANGLIPPPGAGNLRLMRYRTGGGSAGNRDAHTIVQLTTTIPYVAGVTNPEPARGGADAETIDALLERAPRAIRHGDRAVTVEDFEDLAMLASPEVARAKCVPLYDLEVDPGTAHEHPGTVSVIIVPRSAEVKPMPSVPLLERVKAYLDAHGLAVVDRRVVGPEYKRVDIKAEAALTSIDRASEVQPHIVEALQRFLHSLTGGFDGAGWDFGRRPHKSDLLRVISAIPGVDHVRSLTVTETPDRQSTKDTTLSLFYAGALDIAVTAAMPENTVV